MCALFTVPEDKALRGGGGGRKVTSVINKELTVVAKNL
jgi:hypothetical protein